MSEIKPLSQLPEATALASDDTIPVVSGGETKKVKISTIQNSLFPGGVVAFETQALLAADLNYPDNTPALVTNDGTATNNGYWRKSGDSGAGSWVQASYDRMLLLEIMAAAVEEIATANKTKLEAVQNTLAKKFAVSDADGNLLVAIAAAFIVDAEFIIDALGGIETAKFALDYKDMNNLLSWSDSDGNLILAVNNAGQLVANFDLVPDQVVVTPPTYGPFDHEINHVFVYGQSLSVGQALPVQSTVQAFDNLMFTRGMRPQYDYPAETTEQWYAALVPAVEELSTELASLAETPATAIGDMVKELILAENGLAYTDHNYQLMLSVPGYGATTIAELSKGAGTGHFERLVEQVVAALGLATASNRTYAVQAVTWVQGESDYINSTTQTDYEAVLAALVSDVNTDSKSATGQTKDIEFISYQLATHKVAGKATPNIALGLLNFAKSSDLFHIACPMYFFDYQSTSNYHLTGPASRWLGAYLGLAYKRIVVDRQEWKPLQPVETVTQGKVATVRFNVPSDQLEIDTTLVSANTNYGFDLVDSGGTPLTISSVAIIGPDLVKVVAAATIPAGSKLRYAWTGVNNSGPVSGPRGNLRDNQGDTIIFDPAGTNKPMHNWCVIFEENL